MLIHGREKPRKGVKDSIRRRTPPAAAAAAAAGRHQQASRQRRAGPVSGRRQASFHPAAGTASATMATTPIMMARLVRSSTWLMPAFARRRALPRG